MSKISNNNRGAYPWLAFVFTGMLLLAACASAPPAPTAKLQAAQQAIAAAERSEASRYAAGEYPDRSVAIEGHTDSVGNEDYNQGLSERRANSVKAYRAGRGIGAARLCASGKGQSEPVAGNDSAAGRQQNRRVEVIISNPPAASR